MEQLNDREKELQEFYRKTIMEIANKIENIEYLRRICSLSEYLYIYKKE